MDVTMSLGRSARLATTFFLSMTLASFSAPSQSLPDPLATARALVDAGKLAESETVLRGYLDRNPNSVDGHFLLGYVLFREKKARESLSEYTAGAKFRRPSTEELTIVASDYRSEEHTSELQSP